MSGYSKVVLPVLIKDKKNGNERVDHYDFNRSQISYHRKYNESNVGRPKSALYMTGNNKPFVIPLSGPELDKLLVK